MNRRRNATGLAVAAQGLAVVCGCLLAFLTALSLTLFREGYYLHKLETSTCLQTIYENVLQAGRAIAEAADLRGDILDSLITPETVRVAVIRRADMIWHGATAQPDGPYEEVITYLQDTITWETNVLWTDEDTLLYKRVSDVCDTMWRSNINPPLSNLLNILMQYRQVAWVLMVVLAVSFGSCLWWSARAQGGTLTQTAGTVGGALALASVLAGVAIQQSGWQHWMPAEDAAYGLYTSWFRGFGPATAACGLALAALVWTLPLIEKMLRAAGTVERTPHLASEQEDYHYGQTHHSLDTQARTAGRRQGRRQGGHQGRFGRPDRADSGASGDPRADRLSAQLHRRSDAGFHLHR